MPDLATETTSGLTTAGTFSVAGRFVSGRPGTTVRVSLEYLTGTNDVSTATIALRGQRKDRFESEARLEGCARGCALASVTVRSDAPATVVFDSLANGTIELVNGDWTRYEPAAQSATMMALGRADLYYLDPPRSPCCVRKGSRPDAGADRRRRHPAVPGDHGRRRRESGSGGGAISGTPAGRR